MEVHDFGVESATLPSLSQMGKGWYFQLFMLFVAAEWWSWTKSRWSWTNPTNPMSPTNSTNFVLSTFHDVCCGGGAELDEEQVELDKPDQPDEPEQ